MQFKALGRDIAAAATSGADGDQAEARAVLWLVRWADLSIDDLYEVTVEKDNGGASVTIALVKKDAYEPPVFTEPVDATQEELRRQAAQQAEEPEPEPEAESKRAKTR